LSRFDSLCIALQPHEPRVLGYRALRWLQGFMYLVITVECAVLYIGGELVAWWQAPYMEYGSA
jgi:hypothetical protein